MYINLAIVPNNAVDAFFDSTAVPHVDAVERCGEAEVIVEFLNGSCVNIILFSFDSEKKGARFPRRAFSVVFEDYKLWGIRWTLYMNGDSIKKYALSS